MFVVLKVVITEVIRRAKPSSRRGLPEIKKVEDGGYGSHSHTHTLTRTYSLTHTNTLRKAGMQIQIRIYSR